MHAQKNRTSLNRRGFLGLAGAGAATLMAGSLLATAPAVDAAPVGAQWQIRDAVQPFGTDVHPGFQYKLWNLQNNNMLIYKRQRFGINIDFVPDPKNGFEGIKFERKSGSGPLKFGEPIAIYAVNGGYLKWEDHDRVVDLGYSPTPVYEWKFTGQPSGTVIKTGFAMGLMNNRTGAYLIWYFQTFGINLDFRAP